MIQGDKIYNYLQKGQQSVSNTKLRIVDLKAATVGSDLVVLGREWALCRWGHVTTIFLKIFYIMGYNLKNARNGKSISKITKWQSLRSLALKNEIL